MMYSCGMFDTEVEYDRQHPLTPPKIIFKGSLESAQTRKIDELLARLEPLNENHTLLDIGFGWGGICIRAAEKYGCRVHGITLSIEQLAFAQRKVRARGLEHLITFELVDYRVFAKRGRVFDRIVSCEMIEAVGHKYLGNFFECVDKLLALEGIFVMQAITMPDARYPVYHKSADFANTIIFPGGCCPSVSALLNAMAANSTLHLENMNNLNLHYAETLKQWRYRFNEALPRILELGFDDTFIRLWNLYLCYCEAGFQSQALNLQMLTFSRPSNPNMIAKRSTKYIAQTYELVGQVDKIIPSSQ
jgi:cyclopropane-fatty-acyl-phospholipid synthase